MTFQIFSIYPTYDNRDAITGSKAYPEVMTYLTQGCALAIAKRYARINCPYSDVRFVVVPSGKSPFDRRSIIVPVDGRDDDMNIPF